MKVKVTTLYFGLVLRKIFFFLNQLVWFVEAFLIRIPKYVSI